MKDEIVSLLKQVLGDMGISDVSPLVTRPEDPIHGDYTTNVAMVGFKNAEYRMLNAEWKTPLDLAKEIQERIIKHQKASTTPLFEKVEIAPPGFTNFFLSEAKLISQLSQLLTSEKTDGIGQNIDISLKKSSDVLHSKHVQGKNAEKFMIRALEQSKRKRIMVEFAHPNTHKAFHIGHLRNITTGESIVRLLESQGHTVIRTNYQGDVGMHIAKALYALLKLSAVSVQLSAMKEKTIQEKVAFLGKAYAAGSKAYEESEEAKKEIGVINKKIYAKDPEIYDVYKETRQWSLDYFNAIYKRVGTHFDRLYFEGEVYESGKRTVLDGLKKGIFEQSDGATIFPGEKYGLHNRVFITSEGNATYEGKDMGLGPLEFGEYHPDRIVHVVGPEQAGYFQVVFEALAQLFPETRGKEHHLIYGWVKLKHGKMSSRSGNVVLGEDIINFVKDAIYKILETNESKYTKDQLDEIAEKAAIGAIKYSFLKVSMTSEIAFDIEESINIHGDSGPYLQYTYARCRSVLRKASKRSTKIQGLALNPEERALARLIGYFSEIVSDSAQNFAPNTLCTYLFQLAQAFNLFYAKHEILGNDLRLTLTASTAQVLKNGLYLLGIEVLEQM